MPLCLRPSATTALLDNFFNATAEQCQDIGQTSWSLSRRLTSRKHAVHTLPWPSMGLIALDLFLGTCSGAQDNFFIKRSAAQNQITPPRCDGVLRLWATGTLVHNPKNNEEDKKEAQPEMEKSNEDKKEAQPEMEKNNVEDKKEAQPEMEKNHEEDKKELSPRWRGRMRRRGRKLSPREE